MSDRDDALRIIAIEGIDGAGKTTLIPELVKRLSAVVPDRRVVAAGEFGSPLGPLLSERLGRLSWLEKVHWFAADRASVLEGLVAGLDQSDPLATLVVWDRYVWSALAYRLAEARQAHRDEARALTVVRSVNLAFPDPTLTIYLDLPVAVSRARTPSEHQTPKKLELVRAAYEDVLDDQAEVSRVDATKQPHEVAEDALDVILRSRILEM